MPPGIWGNTDTVEKESGEKSKHMCSVWICLLPIKQSEDSYENTPRCREAQVCLSSRDHQPSGILITGLHWSDHNNSVPVPLCHSGSHLSSGVIAEDNYRAGRLIRDPGRSRGKVFFLPNQYIAMSCHMGTPFAQPKLVEILLHHTIWILEPGFLDSRKSYLPPQTNTVVTMACHMGTPNPTRCLGGNDPTSPTWIRDSGFWRWNFPSTNIAVITEHGTLMLQVLKYKSRNQNQTWARRG